MTVWLTIESALAPLWTVLDGGAGGTPPLLSR